MFKNLKSLFFEEVKDGSKKEQAGAPQSEGKAEDNKTGTKPIRKTASKGLSGKVTAKFMEILFKAMEDNNLEGFDYLEFKQSLKSLEKMPMDEQTRFKSAFAMAQTMDATPAHLIQTAKHYLSVLNQEEKKFEEALANQRTKQIGEKEKNLGKLDQTVKNKSEQIKKLTLEIEKHQKAMDRIKQEVANASIKVESTKNDFIASYNIVVSQISKDVENMQRYLK